MVSKVVPQVNVFAVGFTVKVGVTLLIVGVSLPFIGGWMTNAARGLARHDPAQPEDRVDSMAHDDKTEKATPKRRGEAREKGQVARSTRPDAAPGCCWPVCSA